VPCVVPVAGAWSLRRPRTRARTEIRARATRPRSCSRRRAFLRASARAASSRRARWSRGEAVAEAVAPVDDGVEALLGSERRSPRSKRAPTPRSAASRLACTTSSSEMSMPVTRRPRSASLRADPSGAARGVEHAGCGRQVDQGTDGPGLRARRPPAELGLQAGVEADEPVVGNVCLHWVLPFGLGEEGANQRAEPSAGCCKRIGLVSSSRALVS
jgi:hypothetical protein